MLDGEKLWITNGGFADLFIVFARANAGGLSAFLVERAFPGVTSGAEERKAGLHGSSTTPIALNGVKVPAANVLDQAGATRCTLGLAADICGDRLAEEQEILMLVSDMLLGTFATDSAALRATHAEAGGLPAATLHEDVAIVTAHDAAVAGAASVGTARAALPGNDAVRALNDAMVRALDAGFVNTVAARRRIAGAMIEHRRYPFDRNYVD